MGCFFSIFKFGTYVVKESEPNTNTGSQVNVPEIRKHSSTPVTELTPKQLKKQSAKPLLAKHPDKSVPSKHERKKAAEKEKTLYTTTFETQVDAAPPHPLEEKLQDIHLDEIEIDTNIFTPEVEDAVVKIQAGVRGYLARKHIHEEEKNCADNDLEIPVVPPPKNFESQTMSPLSDLDKWKSLSQHLEDKAIDVIVDQTQPKISGPLTEAVIPLKDSSDHKVIDTYVCKENILDVEPTEEQPVFSQLKTDERVVDRVFNVLMSETESESIINYIETNKSKIESSVVEPIKEMANSLFADKTDDNSQESEVLAKLNEILDNETDVKTKEDIINQILAEEPQNEESLQSKAVELVPQNTTQKIIKNSFQEFVKEMTETPNKTDSELKVEELSVESQPEPTVEEPKVDERKTDSMIFEEEVVNTIFNEEMNKNQIFAIEVFKDDVKDEQLANVTTICEPEPTVRNIWGVEEKACKTSIDQFVVKPVEPPILTLPSEVTPIVQTLETIPILETEQKIEVFSSQSRKNSEDLLESEVNTNDELLIHTEEVLPVPSPSIQVEEQNGNILDEEEAAIRIQAAFRGFQIRRSMSREASPNRTTNRNNNIDSNNNNHNNRSNDNDIEFDENAVQWIESNYQTNNELTADFNPSEQPLITTEVSDEANSQLLSTSVEQIDTSLEKLEDQLMHELMSSAEEEERTQALLNDSLDTTQKFMDDLDSGSLTAPQLLQMIQKSMSSNASNADPEEQVPEVAECPETVPIDAQTPVEEGEGYREVDISVRDRPMIEKSDTIIDLMSSSPQNSVQIFDLNETNVNLIESDVNPIEDNHDLEQLSDSEVVDREEGNSSPAIVSEVLKESKPEIEVKTEKIEVSTESCDPRPEPQVIEEVKQESIETQESKPVEEPKIAEPEIVETTEVTQNIEQIIIPEPESAQIQETIETPLSQPIETPKPEQIQIQEVIETSEPKPIEPQRKVEFADPEAFIIGEAFETPEPQPIESLKTDNNAEQTPENIESSKPESNEVSNEVSEPEVLQKLEPIKIEEEPDFQSAIEPPTPDLEKVTEITPELTFIRESEQAVLTKICSTESEQETEVMSSDKIVESRPSMIPVLESNNKSGEQTDTVFKRPKPILKEKESKIYTNIIPDEQTHSTSEEISSPDDENPEFVGLGPNSPMPVRASSPNPFGKKRRRGKKGTGPRK